MKELVCLLTHVIVRQDGQGPHVVNVSCIFSFPLLYTSHRMGYVSSVYIRKDDTWQVWIPVLLLDTQALSCDIHLTAQEDLDKVDLKSSVWLLRTCLKAGAILNVKVWSNCSSGTAKSQNTRLYCWPFSEYVTRIPCDVMWLLMFNSQVMSTTTKSLSRLFVRRIIVRWRLKLQAKGTI